MKPSRTPAEERLKANRDILKLFARTFVKDRATYGTDLRDAANILGVHRTLLLNWYKGNSRPYKKVADRVFARARALGYVTPDGLDFTCTVPGCDKPYRNECNGHLSCPKHLYHLSGRAADPAEKLEAEERRKEIEHYVEMGYGIAKAIRLAGLEGIVSRQAYHAYKRRVAAKGKP